MIYNKEVQTTAIETETPQVSEDEIRQQIMRERELEAERIAQDKELEEESVQLEKEIEQEIRGAFCFPSFHFPLTLATETVTTYRAYGRGTLAYTQCT